MVLWMLMGACWRERVRCRFVRLVRLSGEVAIVRSIHFVISLSSQRSGFCFSFPFPPASLSSGWVSSEGMIWCIAVWKRAGDVVKCGVGPKEFEGEW